MSKKAVRSIHFDFFKSWNLKGKLQKFHETNIFDERFTRDNLVRNINFVISIS